MCVNSVDQKSLGRGINVVVVDPRTKSVIKIQNFDTYAFSKNQLIVCCTLFQS